MIRKQIALVFTLGIGLMVAAFQLVSDNNPTKDQLLMEMVLQSLKYHHYAPEDIDDAYSEKVYDMYLSRMDNSKRFFLQEDIDQLKKYRTRLDNQALKGEFTFFDLADELFVQRFEQATVLYKEVLAKPFNFSQSDSLETDEDKIPYAKNQDELKERWHKYLKYRVLQDLQLKLKRQEEAQERKDTSLVVKTFEVLEQEAREKILKQHNRWAKDMAKEDRDDKMAAYMNVFTNVLEPHTSYFPPLEKENFNIRMSGKLEGIGAQLIEEDGYVKVVRVVPGSASARQGELQVDDKIIKVAQGEGEPVSIVDMKLDDVLPLIRGKKGTEVRLTVLRPDGSIKTIPIVRDVVVLAESYAKSAVMKHKKHKKEFGVIDLRSFYADFQDMRNGRRCAKDVKKEVEKLIGEGVDGIVIDLRFNGGGSLSDVVDMTGLFIDQGPVVQVKSKGTQPRVLSDNKDNGTTLYEGPLVIMVNSYSASASEIMAAALQDYGRALIVGTAPSTFGKGTVQRFFSLDRVVPARFKELGELGAIKITIQKFYRVNGGSTQLRGVEPDIVLPGVYSYRKTGEKEEEHAMEWTEIAAAPYDKVKYLSNMERVKKRSKKRVEASGKFALLDKQAKWYKELEDKTVFTLNLEQSQNERKLQDERSKEFKAANKVIEQMELRSLAVDIPEFESDSIRQAGIDSWHKRLKKDPYLEEVFYIMNDMK